MPLIQRLTIIISSIPLFVWPLLILLIGVGIRGTKDRSVPIILYYVLPFIGLSLLNMLNKIDHWRISLPIFLLSYVIGYFYGMQIQSQWIVSFEKNKVLVKGEWITFITLMLIFVANFVYNMLAATAPMIVSDVVFLIGFISVIGACAGMFLGRSVCIIRAYNLYHRQQS